MTSGSSTPTSNTLPHAPLALYVHWPFCLAKCPYCDFNSHVRPGYDAARFTAALLAEMRFWRARTGPRALGSIFFGGGTPSLMRAADVARLIETATTLWPPVPALEITLEANPTSAEAEKFKNFRASGVNRLSLGVQALQDDDLKNLGRQHNAAEALKALEAAAKIFPRFSCDLIYARKNQTCAQWEEELRRAVKLAGTHLSLYQLTIEPDTAFALQTAQGARLQADEEEATKMFMLTQDLMAAENLPAYEVSNHARVGDESRHNLTYWHYHDYVGVGAGAHGRLHLGGTKYATRNIKNPEGWCRVVEEKENGAEECTALSIATQKEEAFMMGLRLAAGIDKALWQERFHESVDDFVNADARAMATHHQFIINTPTHLYATREGLMRLTTLTGKLLGG